jgi:hypothetical protein
MTLSGSAPGATGARSELDLWVPDRGLGPPVVTGQNVSEADAVAVPGGWRVSATATGEYHLDVRPASASAAAPGPSDEATRGGATGEGAALPATGGGAVAGAGAAVLLLALAASRIRRWT